MSDLYHADSGDVKALHLREVETLEDGKERDNIMVFSDGLDGSGLSVGVTVLRSVARGNGVGEWTPEGDDN